MWIRKSDAGNLTDDLLISWGKQAKQNAKHKDTSQIILQLNTLTYADTKDSLGWSNSELMRRENTENEMENRKWKATPTVRW